MLKEKSLIDFLLLLCISFNLALFVFFYFSFIFYHMTSSPKTEADMPKDEAIESLEQMLMSGHFFVIRIWVTIEHLHMQPIYIDGTDRRDVISCVQNG